MAAADFKLDQTEISIKDTSHCKKVICKACLPLNFSIVSIGKMMKP